MCDEGGNAAVADKWLHPLRSLRLESLACLRCRGVIINETLRREAERYGAAGGRAQVVWPNGVLASTALGLAMQILTPWHAKVPGFTYLEYDGNKGTVTLSGRAAALAGRACPHHPAEETGDPLFDIRGHLSRAAAPRAPDPESPWRRVWRALLQRWDRQQSPPGSRDL